MVISLCIDDVLLSFSSIDDARLKYKRADLCKTVVMRNVFERLCSYPNTSSIGQGAGILKAYENGFRNLNVLDDICECSIEAPNPDLS